MAKHLGLKMPDDLIAALKSGQVVATLATFSEKGLPHTTPMQILYPKGRESILMTINRDHTGYHNMVWQKKVMLNLMYDDNVAYSILARAGVVRAPSHVHPLMYVVRLDIIDIKCDRSVLCKINQGIRWEYTSVEAEQLSHALLDELKELSETL